MTHQEQIALVDAKLAGSPNDWQRKVLSEEDVPDAAVVHGAGGVTPPMRVISWNIRQGGGTRIAGQVATLDLHRPDVVALQEVRAGTVPNYQSALSAIGLTHCLNSFALAADTSVHVGGRRDGLFLASRWPLTPLPPTDFPIPYPERVLSAILDAPFGQVEFHNAHIPNGTNHSWKKIETFEGIHKRLSQSSLVPRLLCGDFNSPMIELADGTVITVAERLTVPGQMVVRRKWDPEGRWASGEHLVMTGLLEFDLADVFRALHGYRVPAFSFATSRNGRTFPRRFDHVFASRSLNPVACQYLHTPRERGLSDHAPVEADFAPYHT